MVIFANGDAPLCNVDYNNKFPTGNIRDKSILNILKSKILEERRNLHMRGQKY